MLLQFHIRFFLNAQKLPSKSISLSVLLMEERICAEKMFAFPHYPPEELLSQKGNRKDIKHQKRKCEGISRALKLVYCRV